MNIGPARLGPFCVLVWLDMVYLQSLGAGWSSPFKMGLAKCLAPKHVGFLLLWHYLRIGPGKSGKHGSGLKEGEKGRNKQHRSGALVVGDSLHTNPSLTTYCGWTKSISQHRSEILVSDVSPANTNKRSGFNHGFLGGAGFCPSTICFRVPF